MAIAVVGVGAQAVATSGNVTAAFPAAYTPTAGHVALVMLAGKATTLSVDNSPAGANAGGWTKQAAAFRTSGNGLQIAIYYRVLAGGESAPAFATPADWSGSTKGMSAQMIVFSGVHNSTPFDATETTDEQAADPYTPASITTATNNAMVVSTTMTNDDNALALSTANGFTAQMSGASYDTLTGGDHSVGVATLIKTPAGAVTMCEWDQTVNGTDGSLSMTLALKDASAGTTYSQNNAGGITPAGALTKLTSRSLTGGITPTGALVKTAIKVLAGGITPSGALATTKLVQKVLTGSITPAGALVNKAIKILAGGLTPAGALAKQLSRALSGGLTPAGALVKQTLKVFAGGITPAGVLIKRTTKVLTGALTPAGALASARTFLKALTGALTPGTGAVATTYIPGGPTVEPGKVVEVAAPTKYTKVA